MRADNLKLDVLLGLAGHIPNAEPADVIVAARRDENVVEVSQAYGAVVLEYFALERVLARIEVSHFDIALVDARLDPYFVPLANLCILNSFVRPTPLISLNLLRVDGLLVLQ